MGHPDATVAVTVPWSWSVLTTEDAGKTVDYGTEGTEHVPDVEAQAILESTYLSVEIYREQLTAGAREHLDYVDGLCADLGCTQRARVEMVVVGGSPAYQQLVTHPSDPDFPPLVSLVTTVRTAHQLTVFVVQQDVDDPAGLERARSIVSEAEIVD